MEEVQSIENGLLAELQSAMVGEEVQNTGELSYGEH